MTTYSIDGQTIYAREQGTPGQQVAIFVHGWSSSWYALSPLIPLLAQRFYCLAVDLPGYGQSPRLAERTTMKGYVDLLAKFIEKVSEGPVVLIGHSMGGMICATLAIEYPKLVERMILISPTITGKLSTSINLFISPITVLERFGLGALIVSAVERMFLGLTDRLMRPVSFAERSDITAGDYHRLRADARRPGQGRVRAECYFAMDDNNLEGRLGKIIAPSLVIWGAEDNTVPLKDSGIVAEEWPEADLRIIPKAGHWPQFETPARVRRYVASFLGLPLFPTDVNRPADPRERALLDEVAQFLTHSDLGNNLNHEQRVSLALQFSRRSYQPGETIARYQDGGTEMFLVQDGTVEVWSDPVAVGPIPQNPRCVSSLTPGQITGELAMLDGGLRSADLLAGPDGARVLALDRERLLALCESDSVLGTRLLWNIAMAMAMRMRFILWQLQRASQRTIRRTAIERRIGGDGAEK